MRMRIAGIAAIGLLSLVLASCGGDDSPTTPNPPAGDTVGSAGGDITAASGQVELNFPANAVAAEITVTVQAASGAPADAGMITGRCYDFGPDGAQFAQPVELTIHYDPVTLPAGVTEAELQLCKAVTGGWLPLTGSTVDTGAHTVTGEVTSFSVYGPGKPATTPDLSIEITPGSVDLDAFGQQPFTATLSGIDPADLEWRVQEEPYGGLVTDGGQYTAPGWVGIFHVIAVSATSPDIADTAEVRIIGPGECIDHELLEYEYVLTFEGEGIYDGELHMPNGLDWGNGEVWVVDTTKHALRKYADDGTFLGSTGTWRYCWRDEYNACHGEYRHGWLSRADGEAQQECSCGFGYGVIHDDPGAFYEPYDVAIDETGNIYVADSRHNQVQVLDTNGAFLRSWGGVQGTEPDQFWEPLCIAVDHAYVYTVQGYPILQKWTRTGQLVWHQPINGFVEIGLEISPDGFIAMCDFSFKRLTLFDPDGQELFRWGDLEDDIMHPCFLSHPTDVEFDADGNIYVLDSKSVAVLSPGGELLGRVAKGGSAMALDDQKNLYILTGNYWVEKWRPVGKWR
ncbi:MAG: NHL repeat-containing protein [bacterium]